MNDVRIWSNEEIEQIVQLLVKILNDSETRRKIIEKLQQRTGIKDKYILDELELTNVETNFMGIRLFGRTSDDVIGNMIDQCLNKKIIIEILPNSIKKAFSAFNSLKETFVSSNNSSISTNREKKFSEYGLKLAVFTESFICSYTEKLICELKSNHKSNTSDISRWASPYYIKDKIQKLNGQLLYEINEYGVSSFNIWLGEDIRSEIYKYIRKKDYEGLFIDNSGKGSKEKSICFITLRNEEIKEEILLYFNSIEQIPYELNAKLNRNFNILSRSLYIISLKPSKIGFNIHKETDSFIPGTQLVLVYFPCKEEIQVTCQNLKSQKSVEFGVSNDQLLFIDVNKNKYTFKNKSLEMTTYCILTYIFGPT